MSGDQANLIIRLLESFKEDNCQEHKQMIKRMDIANGGQKKNTEARLKVEGGWLLFKMLFGTAIISNVLVLVKLFIIDK